MHETKGDSVAKGEQGLLNLDPRNVVFYVGGYPSSFTVRWATGRDGFWGVSVIPLELPGGKATLILWGNQDQTCPNALVSFPASSHFALSQLPWVPGAGHPERGGGEPVQLPTHLPAGYHR